MRELVLPRRLVRTNCKYGRSGVGVEFPNCPPNNNTFHLIFDLYTVWRLMHTIESSNRIHGSPAEGSVDARKVVPGMPN